jgi:hypothetical protein
MIGGRGVEGSAFREIVAAEPHGLHVWEEPRYSVDFEFEIE